MSLRIGFGYDVHRLAPGRPLNLGGIVIPHNKGTVGHSDGDALIHSVCDALLGAANMRDIGYHFPDTSPEFLDMDSKVILLRTLEMIASKGYAVVNIDSTICLEVPKIKDTIPEMQKVLAGVMKVDRDQVSIKATTSEKMGFIGREEGVSVYSVALISKPQQI